MERKDLNWGIISAIVVIMVILVTIGVAFLFADLDNDGTEGDNDDIDTTRGEYSELDRSIFRGLSMEQVYERTRQAIGSPELEKRTIIYDHSFEKEVHYRFTDGKYLMLRTEFLDGEPFDHFISINLNMTGEGEIVYDPMYAVNETLDYFRDLLSFFDLELGNDIVTELEGRVMQTSGWRVIVKQIFNGNLLTNKGLMAEVDLNTGKVTHIWVYDWLFIDEVKLPIYDWDHGSQEILESLTRMNYTTQILLEAEPYPSWGLGWSEFVHQEVNDTWIDHLGYASVMGRYCGILSIEYWSTGNFSTLYRDPSEWDNEITVWVNGTVVCTHKWFFDTQTGKLLKWTLTSVGSSTEQDFPENLDRSDTTWDERFGSMYPDK
ncbi:MAG: hypothetical protein JXA22_03990 [Candidatus Thermoplasmatota archaeon]|nr:hypothetical protein [Candidatus Thermoplasmatota archaeon]